MFRALSNGFCLESQRLDLTARNCRTSELKADGALWQGQVQRLLLTAFPHSSMIGGVVAVMASRVEEGMSYKGGSSR